MQPAASVYDELDTSPEIRAEVAMRLVVPISDVVLVLDRDGIVRSVSGAPSSSIAREAVDWKGRRWLDLVARNARTEAEKLVREATREGVSHVQVLGHAVSPGLEWSLECCVAAVGRAGGVLVIGRDRRSVSTLEARLADLQQTLERDYRRMRQAESRYRLLFGAAREAVLMIDPDSRRITDVNGAATQLLGAATDELVGREVFECFDRDARQALDRALRSVCRTGDVFELRAVLASSGQVHPLSVSASHADDAMLLVVHADVAAAESPIVGDGAAFHALVEGFPDAIALGNEQGVVRTANPAFADLVGLARPDLAVGRRLTDWVEGRGQDLSMYLALLRHEGHLVDVPVVVQDAQGVARPVILSAARLAPGDDDRVAFVLRSAAHRAEVGALGDPTFEAGQEADQSAALVGRVSLPRLVREATSRVELGLLQAALERAAGNRTTAAELLGISRQSLYTKLRRYGLLEGDAETSAEASARSA